jgi:hypothetical protein
MYFHRHNRLELCMLTDDSPVNAIELAKMRCCRATINNHKRSGYRFEFGNRTKAGHYNRRSRDNQVRSRALHLKRQPRPGDISKQPKTLAPASFALDFSPLDHGCLR